MALPAASVIMKGATQLLGTEAAGVLAKKFGGAVYDRIFSSNDEEKPAGEISDLSASIGERPTREEVERAFEALESRLILVLDRKAAADRSAVLWGGSVFIGVQLVILASILAR